MKGVYLFPENMQLNNVYRRPIHQNHFKLFGCTPPFLIWKNNLNSYFFRVFLRLKNPLMTRFNETRAPTSRKYLVEQGLPMSNGSKRFQTFQLRSPVFALEEQSEKLNFESLFTSNKTFGAQFQQNACTIFQKICI